MFGRNNEKALSKGDNMMNVKKPDDILAGSIVSQTAYGENGWQSPAYHLIDVNAGPDPLALHRFKLRAGTPSFNNFCDLDRLLQTMIHLAAAFEINRGRVPQIALAVKHGNACGAGCSDRPNSALSKMIAGDTRAIMGGLVMTNFPLDAQLADHLLTYLHPAVTGSKNGRRLLDGIIAPEITDDAIELMKRKKDKCRIFTNPSLASLGADSLDQAPLRRQVRGGYLLQPNYCFVAKLSEAVPLVPDQHGLPADPEIWENLLMAWAIAATQTSNTITIVNKRMLIGNGVGQQDRVGAARLAIEMLIDRKQRLFPDDRRLVVGWEVTMLRGRPHIQVASAFMLEDDEAEGEPEAELSMTNAESEPADQFVAPPRGALPLPEL